MVNQGNQIFACFEGIAKKASNVLTQHRLVLHALLALVLLMPALFAVQNMTASADSKSVGKVTATAQGVVEYRRAKTEPKDRPTGGRITAPVTATGTVKFRRAPTCPEGSERIGEKCVKECPAAMYRYRGKCLCPEGLSRSGKKCIEVATTKCQPPEVLKNGKCEPPPAKQLTLTPEKLLGGRVAESYPETTFLAVGGTRPYTFTIVDGALPPGLKLSPAGKLDGTPTKRGVFSIVVGANDKFKSFGERPYSITILEKKIIKCPPPQIRRGDVCETPPTISLAPSELKGGYYGVPYTGGKISASGGGRPHVFEIAKGSLPPGLALSQFGELTGTPSQKGTFRFTVRAIDAQDFTGSRVYSVVIGDKPEDEGPTAKKCPPGQVLFGANCVEDESKKPPVEDDPDKKKTPLVSDPPRGDPPTKTVNLALPLQRQLKRLGCLRGRVDGKWGAGSRRALSRFVERARLRINRREPTQRALNAARSKRAGFCRTSSGPKPPPKKKCYGASFLDDDGTCQCDKSGYRYVNNGCQLIEPVCYGGTYRSADGRCLCPQGTYKRGNRCVPTTRPKPPKRPCPANAYKNDEGRCQCRDGYAAQNNRCVRRQPCPPNAYRNNQGGCQCNKGFNARGNRCVRVTPPKRPCPPNAYRNQQGNCQCNKGYNARGNRCVRVTPPKQPCPPNAYRNQQGNCQCNKGFNVQGNRCVRVAPRPQKCTGGQYYDRQRRTCRCEGTRVFDRRVGRCVSRQRSQQQRQQRKPKANNARCIQLCRPKYVACMRQTNNNKQACLQVAAQCVRATGC